MATTPQFTATPRIATVRMALANTSRDGTGILYTLDVGRANGTLVSWICFQALGPTNPGILRAFLDGQLFQEIATLGAQPSGSAIAEAHALVLPPAQELILGEGQVLQVSTNNPESWNVIGFMGDF
jgi:hypothetical protein